MEKRRKSSQSNNDTKKRAKDVDLFERAKFNIGILKPDLEYIMQDNNLSAQLIQEAQDGRPQVESPIKVKDGT